MRKFPFNPGFASMLILITAFLFFSCKKSDYSNSTANSFTFTYDGNTYTTNVDSAVTTSLGPFIVIANFSSGLFTKIQGSLTSFNIGSYSFGTGASTMRYIDNAGNLLQVTSGSWNITANSNNLMSGNFSATVVDASSVTHSTSGSFTNMPISF